ncbi:MAG TPA: hypothetical protein DCY12_11820 [Candidatus Atribacteria bacterium]|nr:hypothetical protein [Candidatus Atribacteria bacterium]
MEEHTLKFLVDHTLGKLAKYLRMLGVDAVYFTQTDVSTLIKKASQEKRIILSRNAKLKKITGLPDFVFINDNQPDKQLSTVVKYFKIHISHEQFFTRCLTCNQKLIVAHHEDVEGRVPLYVFETHKEFCLCPQCKKVYWEGTHLKKMREIIGKVLGEKDSSSDFIDA